MKWVVVYYCPVCGYTMKCQAEEGKTIAAPDTYCTHSGSELEIKEGIPSGRWPTLMKVKIELYQKISEG